MQPTAHQEPVVRQHTEGPVLIYAGATVVPPEGIRELVRLPKILKTLSGSTSRQTGRETLWRWDPPWLQDRRLVVRQSAHGGLLGRLWGALFLSPRPMLRELEIALHAYRSAVPTCRPVALRLERVWGLFWRAHHLSEEVSGAQNLLELCQSTGPKTPYPPEARRDLAQAIAQTISAMHEAGIRHGDLNLKNLLVAERQGRVEAYVIDFKKACLQNHVSVQARLRNLIRLDRSVMKWPAARRAITVSDRLRTLRAYLALQPQQKENWKAIAHRIRTRHSAHAPSRK